MKVLLLVTGLSMGGAERVVVNLADALIADGNEVLLVYMKGPLQVQPTRAEVRLVCLEMEKATDLIPGYLRFRSALRKFSPDIVHSHMFHAVMLARLTRFSIHIPRLISTMHTTDVGGRLWALAHRLTDRLTDVTTNVSHGAVDAFVAAGAVRSGRMIAVYNGISVDDFHLSAEARARVRASFAIAPDCKLLLAVGRLHSAKDYPNMFHALAWLRDRLDFKLLIAGEGPLRKQLEALVGELKLSSQVQFLGIRRDIADLMSAADIYVLSSVGEAFGLVVAEAMACERVVVATDCGGVREVLGEAGFLVPRMDSMALAQALLQACALNREDAIAMGKAARCRIIERYSFERSFEQWRTLYADLLASRGDYPGWVVRQ
jgi:glycosyltransferase involved in cell wall biosynthesis